MLLLLALLACRAPGSTDTGVDPGVDTATDTSADTAADTGEPADVRALVFSALPLARARGEVADGLDLDGETTVEGDSTGCGVVDYTSPAGARGIDNSFATILPALEAEATVPVDDGVPDAIHAGELLDVLVLEGFEGDEPRVTLVKAAGTPSLGADGELEWSQTLEQNAAAPEQAATEVTFDGRTLTAGPFDVGFPVEVRHVEMDLALGGVFVRLTLRDDGSADGVIGGQLDVTRFVFLADAGNGHATTSVEDTVLPAADMAPGEDGVCGFLSVALDATAVPVHLLGGP